MVNTKKELGSTLTSKGLDEMVSGYLSIDIARGREGQIRVRGTRILAPPDVIRTLKKYGWVR